MSRDWNRSSVDWALVAARVGGKALKAAIQPRRATNRRKPDQPERREQKATERLLRSLGAEVWSLGTTRRKGDSHFGTMMSAGLPDLLAFLPGRLSAGPSPRVLLVVECKAKGGRLRPEQKVFRAMCLDAGVAHVVGDCDAVINWLLERGYLKASQVPHYRLP